MLTLFCLAASADPGSPDKIVRHHLDLDDATAIRTIPWAGGARVRVQQRVGDLRVDKADRLVILDPEGRVREVRGTPVGPVETTPVLTADDAIARVHAPGRGELWSPRAELVVFGPAERLAWAVEVSSAEPVSTWRVWVDARDGHLLHGEPTGFFAEGQVYGENPVVDEETETVTLLGLLRDDALQGEYADAFTCDEFEISESPFGVSQCYHQVRQAVPDADGNYLFEPDPAGESDPLAEVHAYHHTDRVARWFDDRFGFRIDPITVNVNFAMTNAFYGDFDGDGIPDLSFGNSEDGIDFGYDADVVYHEYGHAVINGISDLGFVSSDPYGMVWTGGSLNEGSADAFSMFLTEDPGLAEYAGSYGGQEGPLRDLSEPRTCPEALHGEVHADGELWGALIWQLYTDPDIGPAATEALAYGAAATWDWQVSWPDAGQSLLDTAAEMVDAGLLTGAGSDAVLAHVEAAKLLDCGRILPLDDGIASRQMLVNMGLFDDAALWPMGTGFSLTVPEGHDRLVFRLADQSSSEDVLGYTIYVRKGEPVLHREVTLSGLGLALAVPETYDLSLEADGDTIWTLTDTDLSIEAGETYYFAVSGRNLGGIELFDYTRAWITVSGATEAPPGPVTEEESPRACGCSATPAPSAGLVLLPLLAWIRRR